jgi:hypothetical protein
MALFGHCRDVRLVSASGGIAEVELLGCQVSFLPEGDIGAGPSQCYDGSLILGAAHCVANPAIFLCSGFFHG